jgi:hypothetical protein
MQHRLAKSVTKNSSPFFFCDCTTRLLLLSAILVRTDIKKWVEIIRHAIGQTQNIKGERSSMDVRHNMQKNEARNFVSEPINAQLKR